MRAIEQQGLHTYLRLATAPKPQRRVPIGHLNPDELLSALFRAFSSQPDLLPIDTVVAPVIVHIGECIQTIKYLLEQESRIPLSRALGNASSRLEVIVLFLAVLELIKQQQVQVIQQNAFGEIYVEARTPEPNSSVNVELTDYGET